MRAAFYARYSSENQREASIEDQFRNCDRACERYGWPVVARLSDEALSGTKNDRPGYLALLAAAKRREFDVIVVDEVSRLWRDQEEQWRAVKRLEFLGIHILGVSDGINTQAGGYRLLLSIRGAMNEEARREIAWRTHRGQEGQVRKGFISGGRLYGYRNVPIENAAQRDHLGRAIVVAVRREIDPEQAKWVVWIYERYADGWNPRRIADELNRMDVPSPGSTWLRKDKRRCRGWAASSIYGDQKRGFGILFNPLYAGQYVWNRTKRVVNPETSGRQHALRPQSEWLEQEVPELRIVPEDLWERVQIRRERQHEASKNMRAEDNSATMRRLESIQKEIANIVAAIKAGAFSTVLQGELAQLESERDRIQQSLKPPKKKGEIVNLVPEAVERYREAIEQLETFALEEDMSEAREIIRPLLGDEVKLVPTADGHLDAELATPYSGLLKLIAANIGKCGTEERT